MACDGNPLRNGTSRLGSVTLRLSVLGTVLAQAACTGTIDDQPSDGSNRAAPRASTGKAPAADIGPGGTRAGSSTPGAVPVSPAGAPGSANAAMWKLAPLSRLTRTQFSNIAADVLGARNDITQVLPDVLPDDTSADANLLVDSYYEAATQLVKGSLQSGVLKGRCTTATDVAKCVAGVAHEIGPLLWRRPLTALEESDLAALVIAPAASAGGDATLASAIVALMVSPNFVFRIEEPMGIAGPGSKLNNYAVATRLAFLAWNSAPDAALLAAAAAGKLALPDQRVAFLKAQLNTEKGARALRNAHRLWLQVAGVSGDSKDPAAAPEFTSAVAADALTQLDRFVADSFALGSGAFDRLWTADSMWTPPSLRSIYGLPAATTAADVKLPAGQRSGIVTQIAVMAASSKSTSANPVVRGVYVYTNLQCQPTLVPPVDVPPAPAKEQNGKVVSDRERFAAHRAVPQCVACHQYFDGVGLGLEQFDLIGKWRTKDGDFALSGAGWLRDQDGTETTFTGPQELGKLLARNDSVRACYTRRMIESARGYRLTELDTTLARGIAALPSNGDMSAVWSQIAADPNFDRRDFAQE